MRVERTVDPKMKESLRPSTPAQSGIAIMLVFMPKDRVLRPMGGKVDPPNYGGKVGWVHMC